MALHNLRVSGNNALSSTEETPEITLAHFQYLAHFSYMRNITERRMASRE